jgi:signal peptidase II
VLSTDRASGPDLWTVIDFMNVGIGALRTGIFNIADIAITFGVIWIIAISINHKKKLVL